MPSIDLRSASMADIPTVAGFVHDFYVLEKIAYDHDNVIQVLSDIVGDASLGRVWIIVVEEGLVGYIVLTFGYSLEYRGRDCFIDELFIAAEHRSSGVGTAVIGLVVDAARTLGLHAIHLEVDRENDHAQALYRKTGFGGPERYLLTRWVDDGAK